MKFTVTPAFTRETEQQPRGTAINPEKYRRCMRLRIESIKLFLVNLGFIFFSNFMFSHQIWKKKLNLIGFNLWLKKPQNLNPFSSLFLYFAVDIHREKFNQGKNSHYVLLLRFSTIWKNIYIYIYIQENVSVMSKTRPTNFKSSVWIRFPKKQKIAIMRMTHWSLLRK